MHACTQSYLILSWGDFLKEWPQERYKVRSTNIPRTLQSASSFALGLYPLGTGLLDNNTGRPALPHGIQPIPVSTTNDPNTDALLNGWEVATRTCPGYEAFFSKILSRLFPSSFNEKHHTPISGSGDIGWITKKKLMAYG
eukprot:g3154.t1